MNERVVGAKNEAILAAHRLSSAHSHAEAEILRDELRQAIENVALAAMQSVPCESEWMYREGISCLEAQKRYQKTPDGTFPMCSRCDLVRELEESMHSKRGKADG